LLLPQGLFPAILFAVENGKQDGNQKPFQRSESMEWVTPQHVVIELNCEVSSYANAEL
jgi:hypothetical protein